MEQNASTISRILVLGADALPIATDALNASSSSSRGVVRALAALSGQEWTGSEQEWAQQGVVPVTLSTKYYTAPVEFHLHRVEGNELVAALLHDVEEFEALLWVVDMSTERSFREVQQFVEKSMEELSFDVSVVIGVAADEARDSLTATVETWCQENVFEYVPIDANAALPSTELTSEQTMAEEKQGMDRVLEALHCNMWKSMKMLPHDRKVPARGPPEPLQEPTVKVEEPVVSTGLSAKNEEEKESGTTAKPREIENHSKSEPSAAGDSFTEAVFIGPPRPSDDTRLNASLAALGLEPESSTTKKSSDPDADPDMDEFNELIKQVRRVREDGKNLSDEERRRRAEEVAFKLMSCLAGDDED